MHAARTHTFQCAPRKGAMTDVPLNALGLLSIVKWSAMKFLQKHSHTKLGIAAFTQSLAVI